MLITCRITTRLTGIESPGWRLFTEGGFERNIDGTEMAGWRVAVVSPEILLRSFVAQLCDPRLLAFLGATFCSNNTAELTCLADALCFDNSFIPSGARLRILFGSKHAARVTLRFCPRKNNIVLARRSNELPLRLKCNLQFLPTMFSAMLAMQGTNALMLSLLWA